MGARLRKLYYKMMIAWQVNDNWKKKLERKQKLNAFSKIVFGKTKDCVNSVLSILTRSLA